jgi:hypothetical protein
MTESAVHRGFRRKNTTDEEAPVESGPQLPPPAGPWVPRWLSPARLAKYRAAAGGDLQRALELYEWNAKLSAALMRDLGHVEIGLRNAYAEVIEHYWSGTPNHWTRSAAALFRPVYRVRDGEPVDINRLQRMQLDEACARVGPEGPPGKVIAELTFGFWRFLSSSAHEDGLGAVPASRLPSGH